MRKTLIILAIVFALLPQPVSAPGVFIVTPDIDESTVRAGGEPTVILRGVNSGFSLPIWSDPVNLQEEMYLISTVPPQWDGVTDFIVHICSAIQQANDTKDFALQIEYITWEHGVDIVPATSTALVSEITTGVDVAWQSYQSLFTISADNISIGDMFDFRIRRIDSLAQNEIDGELAVWHTHIMYTRGDLSGFLEDSQMEAFSFLFLPLALTIAFYFSRQPPLGFASGVSWFIYGTYALSQSTTTWDNYYALFIFCAIALTLMCFLHALNLRKAGIAGAAEQTDADLKGIDDSLWGKDKNALYYTVDDSYQTRAKKKKAIRRNAMAQGMKEGEAGRF